MKYDCGIFNPTPASRLISRVQSESYLPEDVRHELRVLLSTPGFTTSYLCHVLGLTRLWVDGARSRYNDEDYRELATENWNSITRDEAIQLCHMRPGTANIPVICQVYIASDLADGISWRKTCKTWKIEQSTLLRIRRYGPFQTARTRLPEWFREKVI